MRKKKTAEIEVLFNPDEPIAKYKNEWHIFLDLSAPFTEESVGYRRTRQIIKIFKAKRYVDDKYIGAELAASSLDSLKTLIEKTQSTTLSWRKKCKSILTDLRKCQYCTERFSCFTEPKKAAAKDG